MTLEFFKFSSVIVDVSSIYIASSGIPLDTVYFFPINESEYTFPSPIPPVIIIL